MKKNVLIFTMFLSLILITTSCSKDSLGTEGPEGTEQGGNEGPEGPEGGGSEQGESGTQWMINQTADEVISGIHSIITFNAATNSFEGTFENLNTNVAQQTRLEIHIIDANGNSTEFGPTPGVDMAPGATRNVTLSITAGASFDKFTMHAEVGVAGSGG